ncbi:hypothetical protein GCM10010967_46250 [Dyadobacter beijingensis]|uniref:DUF3006 family protein n=1 Tax=Dyadobacter beijingensis TaxID=365489 RepID=A0ABQ2ICG7_9BACT|nr:hypothetical protein [Dyadobacter beijingensis]GGN05790.1 hypothetical protein GCM10010967_46250 [Dyadobacter beijingensis]
MQPTLYTAMLRIEGTYQNGRIELDSAPVIDLPVKVIITFPEIDGPVKSDAKSLRWSDFSFDRSRQLLKELKSSLAEEVISERRHS